MLARIKSILRRVSDQPANAASVRRLRFAGWTLDLGAQHLLDEAGVVTPLSGGEFKLLQALAEHANAVMSRDQLMEAMNGKEAGPFDRTVDVMIGRGAPPPGRGRARAGLVEDHTQRRLYAGLRGGSLAMKWLPRTLYGQILLTLVGGLLLANALGIYFILSDRDRLSNSFGCNTPLSISPTSSIYWTSVPAIIANK